jgi:predicted nucleotidyltransferase
MVAQKKREIDAERRRAIAKARELTLAALSGIDADAYLFGSSATGGPRTFSDIDIAILPKSPVPTDFFANLAEAFEESDIPYEVDLVDLRDTTPEFYARVRREGIVWKG